MIRNRRAMARHSGLRKPTGLMNRFAQAFIDPLADILRKMAKAYARNKRKEDKDEKEN